MFEGRGGAGHSERANHLREVAGSALTESAKVLHGLIGLAGFKVGGAEGPQGRGRIAAPTRRTRIKGREATTAYSRKQIMETIFRLLLALAILAAIVGFWFVLFRKAGYETGRAVLMAIGMLVPLVNLGILIYFTATTWPIQAEVAALRGKPDAGNEDDAQILLSAALRLETSGNIAAAIAKYKEVIQKYAGTEAAHDAEVSIRSLKTKIG